LVIGLGKGLRRKFADAGRPAETEPLGKRLPQHQARPAPAQARPSLPPIEEVLEFTTDCVALLDHKWRFTFLNRKAIATIGGKADLIGTALHDVFVLEKDSAEWKKTQAAAAAREAVAFEFHAAHLGLWFEVHIHPSPSGLQIYFRDITQSRAAKLALARSEETLRLGLEAAGDAAWDWDLTEGRIAISGRMVKALGYGDSSFDGSIGFFTKLIHPDDVRMASRTLQAHLAGHADVYRCAYRVRAKDGRWRWNLDRGRVIERDPITNWATRIVGTSSDISDLGFAQRTAKRAV